MIDMKDVTNHDDVVQWVHGGFFLLESSTFNKLTIAALIAGPGMGAGTPTGKGWSAKLYPSGVIEHFDHANKIHPTWPMCGAVNLVYTKNALWVDRLPKKQWKRTFNYNCVSLSDAHGASVSYQDVGSYENPLICAIFDPEYFTYQQFKENDWATGALSHSLVLRKISKGFQVYLYSQFVGSIDLDDKFSSISPTTGRKVLQQLSGYVTAAGM